MLKVELHAHTAEDPVDRIPYSACELIDHAALLGYHAVAVTLHDRQLGLARLTPYAAERGVVLIPGIERTIEGKHVLLLNFSARAEEVCSFDDLARLKAREAGIVIAPHPFFPAPSCLRGRLDEHPGLFDAVEWNAMYTVGINFNKPARRWAEHQGKPLVGNGDVHRLYQLGTCYSLVDAERHPDAICEAIRRGRVKPVGTPLTLFEAARTMADLATGRRLGLRPVPGARPRTAPA